LAFHWAPMVCLPGSRLVRWASALAHGTTRAAWRGAWALVVVAVLVVAWPGSLGVFLRRVGVGSKGKTEERAGRLRGGGGLGSGLFGGARRSGAGHGRVL